MNDVKYNATNLKQIVALIVHPHLIGWMFLWTFPLTGVCNVRR